MSAATRSIRATSAALPGRNPSACAALYSATIRCNLRPTNFRQGEHEPQAWDPAGPDNQPASRLTVVLPGEIATAVVIKVVSRNAVVAQLGPVMCTGRGHSYRAKDIVPVRRENDEIGGECWSVVSDRELQQNEMIGRFIEIECRAAGAAAALGPEAGSSRWRPWTQHRHNRLRFTTKLCKLHRPIWRRALDGREGGGSFRGDRRTRRLHLDEMVEREQCQRYPHGSGGSCANPRECRDR